jgi:glycosyltransferase involved in cell wall biosynthesis
MKRITILVPCYNEQDSLPALSDALKSVMGQLPQYDWEVLLVNDGSKDNTISIIKEIRKEDKRFCYVDLSRNFGKENAMLAGFDYATGDAVVIMDADLQHPPSVIPEMLKKWEEGYDDVYGRRLTRGKESWLRKKLSMWYYSILQKTTRVEILQNVGDFRLLDRKCIEELKKLRETERYTKGMYCWIGFKKTAVDFETQDRIAGESSMSFKALISLAIDGITSFTIAPLRMSAVVGFVVSIVAFIYMCFVLFKTIFIGEDVQGYPTLVILILFIGGVQLISLGIIGEYLGKIFNETKNRPVYVVGEYQGNQEDNGKNRKD